MALNFPNMSRSYEPLRQCVRFWGYDGALEICFFVEQGALSGFNSNSKLDEAGYLSAFDRFRDRILEVARTVYSRRRRDAYILQASDF